MDSKHQQLNILNQKIGGSISRLEGDRILQFQNDHGKGRAISVDVGAGILYSEYSFELVEKMVMELDSDASSVLYFVYCLEGNLDYAWKDKALERQTVQELQTVILRSNDAGLRLYVGNDEKTDFAVIKVNLLEKEQNLSVDDMLLNHKLFNQFLTNDGSERFEYHGTFNLKIKEQLLQIRNVQQIGVVRKLLIKSIVHFTLALELMHHQRDMANQQETSTWLSKSELLRIQAAIDAIAFKPEYPYSVNYLCREYGVSATKLQEGFKVLAGMTATNYIRKQRIELAERLIKAGDLNISEIVYSIGFTSRSYFSKIFKKRYNCTPKYYLEHCRQAPSA
ncbi:helix-turn-helix domain-containing protein [Sediminibacter sp. Hel_I_10]|uniref:AraC family transcriptional regulator n=1 Tax=Sediminibacter sp. Hel_I_10 TaxID=1392490 RepID=UPI00047ECACA|nr:helix-turn-helix domain-containing protein [Sediminibacter sp. Hel_I_10]